MKRYFAMVVLVIVISLSGNAEAKLKFYKSNSNLPFVEMMLNMMVVMGILDQMPMELLASGGYLASPWGYQNSMEGFPGSSVFRNSPYNYRYQTRLNGWQPMRPSSCIGGYCPSRRGNALNGLWINEEGEMLGIQNNQFFWTDGRDAYTSGLMNISKSHVVANVDGSNRQISYQYRVKGNELLTRDESGVIRRFWRYPTGRIVY